MNSRTPKGHADYEWAVKWNRDALGAIGVWPVDDHGIEKFLRNLRAMVAFVLITFICTIPCFCSLIMKCDNLTAFIDNLGYFIPFVITLMKFLTIYGKRRVLLPVIRMIAEDWAKRKTDAEEDVMIRHARVGRTFGFIFGTLAAVLVSLTLVLPKFGVTLRYVRNDTDLRKTFPIPCYYSFDVTRSPYFEMTLIGQLVAICAGTICYTGLDNFLGILILHICGQLENLRARLANIGDSVRFDRELAGVINDHARLIRATDAVERTFTMLLLALLLYFGTFACIYGVLFISVSLWVQTILPRQARRNSSDKARTRRQSPFNNFSLACILVNTFLQTFFYCIAGQILATKSEGMYDAAYQCEWPHLKLNEAKCLILIMARAKTPLYITAGKLFPMTLLTYCKILKVSLGYLSFLLTKL
ncbi:odorant receptor 19a-like [Andrena cerasifolii]|uniref:odorant receptor 19a-like n=1 Tax=Andrena cerasifolii TaxID=2819439 RepID=UPI004037B9A0